MDRIKIIMERGEPAVVLDTLLQHLVKSGKGAAAVGTSRKIAALELAALKVVYGMF